MFSKFLKDIFHISINPYITSNSHTEFIRKDRSKEFYNISGRMLIAFEYGKVFTVNIYGDAIKSYRKEDFLEILTPEEAQKFKEDFIEYFV